jgi:hypothetical protein
MPSVQYMTFVGDASEDAIIINEIASAITPSAAHIMATTGTFKCRFSLSGITYSLLPIIF